MKTPDQTSLRDSQAPEQKNDLSQVFQILKSDAIEGQQMMCQRMGDTLSFSTLFASEQVAQNAYNQLVKLGQQPRLESRTISLTTEFPGDEIDKLAGIFNSIPKRKE